MQNTDGFDLARFGRSCFEIPASFLVWPYPAWMILCHRGVSKVSTPPVTLDTELLVSIFSKNHPAINPHVSQFVVFKESISQSTYEINKCIRDAITDESVPFPAFYQWFLCCRIQPWPSEANQSHAYILQIQNKRLLKWGSLPIRQNLP